MPKRDMKRATTTLVAFCEQLRQLECELDLRRVLTERVEKAALDDYIAGARLLVSEQAGAPPRGRGRRIVVEVITCWNEPPFRRTATPLDVLGSMVARLPGVEAVGDATVDTQLRSIWGFWVTLRLAQ
jgi:hypothetical protein